MITTSVMCMRRKTGPSHAHPKEVVVVEQASVPTGLETGGEAYLVHTWLLELEKHDIHKCMIWH